jgi:hypothetical protein
MIEKISKCLELVLLLNNNSERVTYAFLNMVFSRFETPTEVLTNQGTKFYGEFQKLCEKALIDHRITSLNHLETKRLMEQMVQMLKWGLRKYGLHKGYIQD